MDDDINVLELVKGKERYIFLYDDDQRADVLGQFARSALNPELTFSWYDAAVMTKRLRDDERAARNRIHHRI
jgi:hypothetical protein